MVVRKKNLLDAFQASAPEGRTAARRNSEVRASAGGPFAPAVSPSEPSSKTVPHFPPGARTSRLTRWLRDRAIRVALVLGAILIVIAYWTGRQHGPAVEASDIAAQPAGAGALLRSGVEPTASPTESELAKRNLATAQAGSTHDQQFLNPANKFTVRVKKFSNDEAGKAAARSLHDYFVKENLPVIAPIGQGKSCVVYVGHADKKKDADLLATYIQRMHGSGSDSKKSVFEDAYVVNIDDVVKR